MTGLPIPRIRGAGETIKDAPDHHDAELVLRLYELRREPVLREARRYMVAEFWPANLEAALAITKGDHPGNAAYRQVSTYWEMAYGMARHGIVNPDYLVESNSEGLLVFAKFAAWLDGFRQATSPRSFRHAEWIAAHCEEGRTVFAAYRERVDSRIQGAGR
jgi:hypothetical protein